MKITGWQHHYEVYVPLGEFESLKAKDVMDRIKDGAAFPLEVVKGNMHKVDNHIQLSPPYIRHIPTLPWRVNNLKVKAVGETWMVLQTLDQHIFRGTARFSVESDGKRLFFQIIGDSPPEGEPLWRYTLNMLYVRMRIWERLIHWKVIPLLRLLEVNRC